MRCPRCHEEMEHKGHDWHCPKCHTVQKGFKDKSNYAPHQMGMFERKGE